MLRYGGLMGIASITLTMLQYSLDSYNGKPLTVFLFGILPNPIFIICRKLRSLLW